MNFLYENCDLLNAPYEAFLFDTAKLSFPVRSHWHYFTEMIYIIEGTAFVESNEREFYVSTGDLMLFHARDIHAIYAASHRALRFLVLKFDCNRLSVKSNYTPKLSDILHYARLSGQADVFFPSDRLHGLPVRDTFELCIREINQKEYGYDVRVHAQLCSLLVEIIRIWQKDGLTVGELSPIHIGRGTSEHDIETITEYIDAHSHESIKVEALAAICHMSYSHFAKCFKEFYGRSCKEYIEFIRIEKGEELLLFTDSSLSEISQESGFSDCSHFIRTFRKWKGTTPHQYRIQQRRKSL